MGNKIVVLFVVLNISTVAFAQRVRALSFEELAYRRCNNSCVLTPPSKGSPFEVGYRVINREIEGWGMVEVAELTLNGKKFELIGTGSWSDILTSFTQYQFFENDRFQMYELLLLHIRGHQ